MIELGPRNDAAIKFAGFPFDVKCFLILDNPLRENKVMSLSASLRRIKSLALPTGLAALLTSQVILSSPVFAQSADICQGMQRAIVRIENRIERLEKILSLARLTTEGWERMQKLLKRLKAKLENIRDRYVTQCGDVHVANSGQVVNLPRGAAGGCFGEGRTVNYL
ncbi:MAG: hypothetical protein DCC75_04490 [Proteobacteria bacterium]|nr:MAG: hypothetical protein DCC75_04490 [Pseudomonadota bacterium]